MPNGYFTCRLQCSEVSSSSNMIPRNPTGNFCHFFPPSDTNKTILLNGPPLNSFLPISGADGPPTGAAARFIFTTGYFYPKILPAILPQCPVSDGPVPDHHGRASDASAAVPGAHCAAAPPVGSRVRPGSGGTSIFSFSKSFFSYFEHIFEMNMKMHSFHIFQQSSNISIVNN